MPPKFVRTPEQKDYANSREIEKRALLDADSEEDDFFLNGPKVRMDKLHGKDPKVSRLQGQVEEVVGVMKSNVEKVLERGDRLEDLQDKSDADNNGDGHSDCARCHYCPNCGESDKQELRTGIKESVH